MRFESNDKQKPDLFRFINEGKVGEGGGGGGGENRGGEGVRGTVRWEVFKKSC